MEESRRGFVECNVQVREFATPVEHYLLDALERVKRLE